MNNASLKSRIEVWAQKVGPKQVQVALVTAGVGVSTAEKLVAGRYDSTPKGDTAFKIERALRAAGEMKSRAS